MNKAKTKCSGGGIVAICALVYFVSYFSRKDFAAVMAGMISDSVIDKVTGGFIGMGLFICYGIGQLVSGYLGDKIKPHILLLSGLCATMLCNLFMPLVPNSWLMIPVWAVNGFAQAMLWPPIIRLLSDNLDHERFVRANLIVTAAAHVSTILLYLYVPLCLELFEWQTVFFSASILSLFAIILLVVSMSVTVFRGRREEPENIDIPTPVSQKTGDNNDGFIRSAMKFGIIPILVSIVMMGFLRDGIDSWLPTLYGEAFGRDASESVLVSVILPIFSILSVVIITALHKTGLFGNEVLGSMILFGVCIAVSIPLVFLIGSESAAVRILCLVLTALVSACMHAVNFLLISCLPGRFSAVGRAATASGICNACTYIGAAISMYGIAAVANALGWSASVISWIAVAAIGVVSCLLALGKYSRFITEKER